MEPLPPVPPPPRLELVIDADVAVAADVAAAVSPSATPPRRTHRYARNSSASPSSSSPPGAVAATPLAPTPPPPMPPAETLLEDWNRSAARHLGTASLSRSLLPGGAVAAKRSRSRRSGKERSARRLGRDTARARASTRSTAAAVSPAASHTAAGRLPPSVVVALAAMVDPPFDRTDEGATWLGFRVKGSGFRV
jgi:hypothetical protein